MAEVKLKIPASRREIERLSLNDSVYLTGTIYTARDKAHDRILEYVYNDKKIPFDLKNGVVFHCGPLMKHIKGKWVTVSAGPTTSSRLNKLQPEVIKKMDVRVVVGKGGMDENVVKAMDENDSVYLAMTGGAGALAVDRIKEVSGVYWLDFGMAEAVWALKVEDFGPLTVAIAKGESLYGKVDSKVKDNLNRLIQSL